MQMSEHARRECVRECVRVCSMGVRLCRSIALLFQVTSPQPKLRPPNIGVVLPQHRSCLTPTSKL